jgi:rsbT co-antagonist protein RsbR
MTDELRREIAALRARAAELEERLEAQERAAQESSARLEKAAAEAQERTRELVRSEDELRRQASILRLVLDSMTDGVVVVDERGELVLANPAAKRMLDLAAAPASVGSSEVLLLPDQETALPVEEHPLSRALRGEPVDQLEIFVQPPRRREEDAEPRSARAGTLAARGQEERAGLFLTVTANPMRRRDGSISGAVAVYRDATEKKRLIEDLEAKNRELSDSEQGKSELVERLRLAIDEVSTPILELWDDILALPVIGVVDSRRSAQIMERLLDEIVQRQSRYVIIDVTGVEMIDTRTADHFLKLMKAVWLLGAECRITGVRPAVAQTLVDLGIDLAGVRASRNLKHALRDLLQIASKATARAHPRLGPGRRRSARKETAT